MKGFVLRHVLTPEMHRLAQGSEKVVIVALKKAEWDVTSDEFFNLLGL